MALATVDDYLATFDRAGSFQPGDPARLVIERQVVGVSDYVERELGREFDKAEAASVREYLAADRSLLTIHDCQALPTAVRIDTNGDGAYDTTVPVGHWRGRPLNALRLSPRRPYERLELLPNDTVKSWGICTVEVTALWGWPDGVPVAVSELVFQLVGILRNISPLATTQIDAVGTTLSASQEAKLLIRQIGDVYKRKLPRLDRQPQALWFV